MKKIFFVIMAMCFIAGTAWSQELSLVETISAPDSSIEGLALDSGEIWVCYSAYATVY